MKRKPYNQPTIYTVVVTHKSGRAVIVETHACIKHARYRINKLERRYATNDLIQPYKVTFITSKLLPPQGE